MDVTMQYLHDFAIQEPLGCLCLHSLAFGSRLRAKKSIYEAPSVLGYAPPTQIPLEVVFLRHTFLAFSQPREASLTVVTITRNL